MSISMRSPSPHTLRLLNVAMPLPFPRRTSPSGYPAQSPDRTMRSGRESCVSSPAGLTASKSSSSFPSFTRMDETTSSTGTKRHFLSTFRAATRKHPFGNATSNSPLSTRRHVPPAKPTSSSPQKATQATRTKAENSNHLFIRINLSANNFTTQASAPVRSETEANPWRSQ